MKTNRFPARGIYSLKPLLKLSKGDIEDRFVKEFGWKLGFYSLRTEVFSLREVYRVWSENVYEDGPIAGPHCVATFHDFWDLKLFLEAKIKRAPDERGVRSFQDYWVTLEVPVQSPISYHSDGKPYLCSITHAIDIDLVTFAKADWKRNEGCVSAQLISSYLPPLPMKEAA